jgi:hypothetical protein
MTLSALDDVLRGAASVRVSEIEWYGEVTVDLSDDHERDRLRAAMKISSLPGYVCVCRGQVRFEFFDARGEPRPRGARERCGVVALAGRARPAARHDAGAARILLVDKARIRQRLDVARLPGPLRVRVREAAAARGYELPKWSERLLLNA